MVLKSNLYFYIYIYNMQLDFNKHINYVILKNHKYYAYFNAKQEKRNKFFKCKKSEIPSVFVSYEVGIIKVFYNPNLFKEKKIINNKTYLIFNDNSKIRGEVKVKVKNEKTVKDTEKIKNREKQTSVNKISNYNKNNKNKNNRNYTKKLSKVEIEKLIQKNKILDKKYNINENKEIHYKKNLLANMTNFEALNIFENSDKKDIILNDENPKLSFILPYFRAGFIGWVPFESLIRQENIDFNWEIIIIEENFENPFGLEKILKYKEDLKKVKCCKIRYISLKDWLPLSAKWYFLVNECSESSKIVAMNSSDIYCSKLRLSKQYNNLINSEYNWYKIGGNIVYDINLDKHVKLFSIKKDRTDTCCAAAKKELLEELPLISIKRGVDGWRYNSLKDKIKFYYDNTMELQNDTININGLNNISLNRESRINSIESPFKKCCSELINHIPKEIYLKLKECKTNIKMHNKNREESNIKIR